MNNRVYLTTTLPYVNAEPHLGHALEFVQADIYARYQRSLGKEVLLNTGTDEHGAKIYQKALAVGQDPQSYCDQQVENFRRLTQTLGLIEDLNFIRTTDRHHAQAAQEFWRRCWRAGDIYKKTYRLKYCLGCELEKTDSELTAGRCPIHPNLELEIREEENYFFALAKYQDKLSILYDSRPDFVRPAYRLNEIKSLIRDRGLQDFSVSRLKAKMPWGIPVPDDPAQVMYVWFDALVNYVSAVGWPTDKEKFEHWWPVIQFAGKDQVRQQAAMWQAMLFSADLSPSKQIVIHGFLNSAGQKMSKSLGNVIRPDELVKAYGREAVRFFLANLHPFEDSEVTAEKIKETYNAKLANGLGNLVSRILTLSARHDIRFGGAWPAMKTSLAIENFEFNQALDSIERMITEADGLMQAKKPFLTIKTNREQAVNDIKILLSMLAEIANDLTPFMPQTSELIKNLIRQNQAPSEPLFPRRD